MAESRIAQLATSPLLQNFAVTASQKAIRPVGSFIAPICEVPDLTFRYKVYTEQNRYRVPQTKRQPGSRATVIGFSATDASLTLEPNALDFPVPNAEQLSDEGLQYSLMEAQSVLADASALALENEIVTLAQSAAIASPLSQTVDFTDPTVDPVSIIDSQILNVMKAAKNGAPVKILFGTTKFKQFRDNPNVRSRFIVSNRRGGEDNVGIVSPSIGDVGSLLMTNPECALSLMVIDQSQPGETSNIQFLLDEIMIIFASSSAPNRMDPSFMKTFARMGGFFRSGTDELGNQRADVFTATILGVDLAAETDSPTFPFEAPIIVRTNRTSSTGAANSFTGGTITFSGKRVGNPTRASGNYQGVTYKFQGPWYDLMNTHFQQLFYGSGSTTFLLPELVLNSSTAVTSGQIMISVGDQIQAILQWLLDQYAAQGFAAPYQYIGRALHAGAIDLNSTGGVYNYLVDPATTTIEYSLFGLFLPSYIAKPMMCADAIQKCLQLSPRITLSFDYSTSPPTFYAALVDNMTPATLALFDGVSHKSLNIQSRNDLLVRCVNLVYRITNVISHQDEVTYAQDKWGPHGSNNSSDPDTGLRVVVELIDLQGVNDTSTTAHIDVEPVLATAASGGTTQPLKRTWWAYDRGGGAKQLLDSHVRFQDATGAGTSIPDATISDPSTQPPTVMTTGSLIAAGLCDIHGNLILNRIVNGSAHTWMVNSDGSTVVSKKIHVSASMTYAEYDYPSSSGTPDTDTTGHSTTKNYTHEHHADFIVTNGASGTYSALASTTPGEVFIIGFGGIAEYLYNHMNVLQFEGEYAKVEVVFGTEVTLRNSINFSGGATTWTTMNAQPQSIRRNYGKKTTEVQIGVAKHLNSGQLSALLNMWRYRRTWYNPLLRTQNNISGSNVVDQAKSTNDANTPAGLVNTSQDSVFSYTTLPNPATSTPGVISGGIVNNPTLAVVHDGLN